MSKINIDSWGIIIQQLGVFIVFAILPFAFIEIPFIEKGERYIRERPVFSALIVIHASLAISIILCNWKYKISRKLKRYDHGLLGRKRRYI